MFKESSGAVEKETVIGPSVKVEGDFIMEGDIAIEGTVRGTVRTSKNLRVGPTARIFADISASSAVVAGEIQGNLKIFNKLELKPTAKIFGDVETEILDIEAGAILNGHCAMGEKGRSSEPESVKQEKIALAEAEEKEEKHKAKK